jgi:hypothetical protein
MAFDYEANEASDDETVRGIASAMAGKPLAPLSPEEIALRELERETQRELNRQREEQWRLDNQKQVAAKAEQERAEWLEEHRKQEAIRQRERAQEIDRLTTQESLRKLQMAAAHQQTFQNDVRNSHAQNVRQQQMTSLMAELDKAINEFAALRKPSPNFSTLYRQNQRSGLYWVEPEDSDK